MSQCTTNDNNNCRRRCLYDILEVSRSSSFDELKIAYKKQAKRWHPDKNMDNLELSTIRFKEINEAYEILSDKHERAWYDAHRDAILRGIDKNEINKMKDNDDYDPDIDLMPYFNPFIFTSFDDNDLNSYYNIYNDIFLRIIDLEKLSKKKTPLFGNSKSHYHKMKEFYDFWQEFESRRSFQWTTKYNLNDAHNRKMRKLMHKENRKLIESKRKKWQDTILKLIAFIKKRDPRFRNYLIDLDKKQKEEEIKMKKYQKEIDEIMKEEYKKQRLIEIEQNKQILNDNNPDLQELFECVVCNKIFKSQNAFNTHQSSKKHIKTLENLKFQLNIENELIFNDELKINDQNNVDAMIAKQIAHQQNVENDDDDNNDDTKPVDLDYLIALQIEQEDIVNAADLFMDHDGNGDDDDIDDNNNNNNNALITDSEIIALLEQPGIDIEALINTYPSLTKEYILNLINKNKSRKNKYDRSNRKWMKNKRKKKKKYDEIFIIDNDDNDGNKKDVKKKENDNNNDDDIEDDNNNNNNNDNDENEIEIEDIDKEKEDLDEFMKKFKTFNKKSNFINKQKKQRNDDNGNNLMDNSPKKKKKRRRRRKNKDTQNQRNMNNINNMNAKPIKSKCKACNQMFGSKNKLYDHLKQFPKHALKTQHENH